MMSSFMCELNASSSGASLDKPLVKISEMVKNKKFKIISLRKVSTVHGHAVMLETDEYKMFLPKRVSEQLLSKPSELKTLPEKYLVEFLEERPILSGKMMGKTVQCLSFHEI